MCAEPSPKYAPPNEPGILSRPLTNNADDAPRTSAVLRRLTMAIAIGEYLPGQRLPSERDLAQILGVGRVTVRTAIGQLIDLRLLRSKQGRNGGTFVTDPETPEAANAIHRALSEVWDRLIELHDAEAWIHGVIAEAAAENRTDADLDKMRARFEEFRVAQTGAAKQHADELFHLAIVHSTHNEPLAETLDSIERQIHLTAPRHPWGSDNRWEEMEQRSLDDHVALFAAIRLGDGPLARETGRRHAGINRIHLEAALEAARRTDLEAK